ncbi:MAG: hypothetical protein E6J65_19140 [Deltaproteobacteria bacterium]|nr:MAG: hypothetical protein E6J65_19140 [Deltaproteobacteria bacterium]
MIVLGVEAAPRANMSYRWTIANGKFSNGLTTITTTTAATVTFTAIATVGQATTNLDLTVVEVNALAEASTPGTATITVVQKPVKPTMTIRRNSTVIATDDVTEGYTYTAEVTAPRTNLNMTYSWTIVNGTFVGSANPLTATGASADFVPDPVANGIKNVTLTVVEHNPLDVTAASTPRALRARPVPRVETVTVTTSTNVVVTDGNLTAGKTYLIKVPARSAIIYAWRMPSAATIVSGAATSALTFMPNAVNPADGTAALDLVLDETNAPSDGAQATTAKSLTVYPAPLQPVVTIDNNPEILLTVSTLYRARVPARPNMTYTWSIPANGTAQCFTAGCTNPRIECDSLGANCQSVFEFKTARPGERRIGPEVGAARPVQRRHSVDRQRHWIRQPGIHHHWAVDGQHDIHADRHQRGHVSRDGHCGGDGDELGRGRLGERGRYHFDGLLGPCAGV